MGSKPVFINPKIVPWARRRIGITEADLAKEIGIKVEQVNAVEAGLKPDAALARKMAKALRIPFGFLFLVHPPSHDVRLPDLRTVSGAIPKSLSAPFIEHLTNVAFRQEWYRANQQELRARPLDFVGKFSIDSEIEAVSRDMRAALGLTDNDAGRSSSWAEFLGSLMESADILGVLVMRSGIAGNNTHAKLSVREFRGFAVSDALAPLVFINGNDAIAAQTFTLVHELAHLWIGKTGISNPNYKNRSEEQSNVIEKFCNRVAAEVLVPSEGFARVWNDAHSLDSNIQRLARHYRVSSFVVLRQALDQRKISPSVYWEKVLSEQEKREVAGKAKRSGGDFYNVLPFRNSKRLTSSVVQANQDGRLSHRDAAMLLGVSVPTLNSLISRTS